MSVLTRQVPRVLIGGVAAAPLALTLPTTAGASPTTPAALVKISR